MIDQIRLTYAALGQAPIPGAPDLRVQVLSGTEGRIRLGLDEVGREHLLVPSPSAPARQSGIAAISTEHRQLDISGERRRYLDVACLRDELVEVFDHFVAAIAEHTTPDLSDLGPVVATVLDRWRTFFTAAGAPPGRDTLAGILGELLVLRDIALANAIDVLNAWVGPRGARHDFRRGDAALELKTSLAHTSRVVSIHGEDQLLAPHGATLHLQFVRLEEGADLGTSITDLLDELVGLGLPRLELIETVARSGLPAWALTNAGTVRFDVRERLTVPVDDRMPRIVPDTFIDGARPAGVIDLSYRIDLDRVADRALSEDGYRELIGRLAGVATE